VTAPTIEVLVTINGTSHVLRIEPRETVADVVRDRLGLTGTKVSCDAQVCGACTVLVDDAPVSACTHLAADTDGRQVRTVEGLLENGRPNRLQAAFLRHAAFQCGFCTAGILMTATALLEENRVPTRQDVEDALDGNLCRCTGYVSIVDAILEAAG
jgi:carbon-monoxide dehydrogenase small subunit